MCGYGLRVVQSHRRIVGSGGLLRADLEWIWEQVVLRGWLGPVDYYRESQRQRLLLQCRLQSRRERGARDSRAGWLAWLGPSDRAKSQAGRRVIGRAGLVGAACMRTEGAWRCCNWQPDAPAGSPTATLARTRRTQHARHLVACYHHYHHHHHRSRGRAASLCCARRSARAERSCGECCVRERYLPT